MAVQPLDLGAATPPGVALRAMSGGKPTTTWRGSPTSRKAPANATEIGDGRLVGDVFVYVELFTGDRHLAKGLEQL
jgi:hypothetical protein